MKFKYFYNLALCPMVGFGPLYSNTSNSQPKQELTSTLMNDDGNPTNQSLNTTVNQVLAWHGSGWDTNVNGLNYKTIDFSQKTKRIFMSKSIETIDGHDFLISAEQKTIASPDRNTGSYRWGNCNYDLYDRVQDWKFAYEDNLRIKSSELGDDWEISPVNLYLTNCNVWPSKSNYHSINGNVVFQNGSDSSYLYQNAKDFNLKVGVSRDFYNKSYQMYGIPHSKLKEAQYVYVIDNFVRRYLWTLRGAETTQKYALVSAVNNSQIKVNSFNIHDLICMCKPDYANGTVEIKFNKEFIDLSKEIEKTYEMYDEYQVDKARSDIASLIHSSLENCYICSDNFEYIWNLIKDMTSIDEITNFVKQNPSKYYETGKKYNIKSGERPYSTLQYLTKFANVTLNYQTPSVSNPKLYTNVQINISNNELEKGKTIVLNKNADGDYELKLNSLQENEYSDVENYVAPDKATAISVCDANITNDNLTYTLKKPSANALYFDETDKTHSTKYAYDLSDLDIVSKFVKVYDSYGDLKDGSLLDPNQYEITRHELEGWVKIKINFNGQVFEKNITGFKKQDISKLEFDANKYETEIFAENINNDLIRNILISNGFDPNIAKQCEFTVSKIDDKNINVEVNVTNSSEKEYIDYLKNKKIKIKNFTPYFIQQNKKIPRKYLSKKASEITKEMFKEDFINMSNEFNNMNNLDIKLNVIDSKTLNAYIKYNDYLTKEDVELNYLYSFKTQVSYTNYILIGVIIVGALILFLAMFTYKKDNKRKY